MGAAWDYYTVILGIDFILGIVLLVYFGKKAFKSGE